MLSKIYVRIKIIMKPKKSLGQNFLTSGKAIFEIVKAGDLSKDDLVLEIGPGKGALTEEILKSGAKVLAIEKDDELAIFLKEKFEKETMSGQLKILNQDILNLEVKDIFKNFKIQNIQYKLIANIPYYITGAIIEKFLSENIKPELMVLLVQKEVAERIVTKDKKGSILSLAVKFYCDEKNPPKIVYRVSAGSFFPKPKVDSAVLKIILLNSDLSQSLQRKKEDKNLKEKEFEKKYFEIVKKSFAHKRKMMLGNLKDSMIDINWDKIFEELSLNKKVRAEDLQKTDFLKIVDRIILDK